MRNSIGLAITLLALSFASNTASAEYVRKTEDASRNGHVEVSIISGSIEVESWTRESVEVSGTVGRNVEDVLVERSGDKIKIKLKLPHKSGRGIDADLTIKVPRDSSLNVGTVSADIDVTGVRGEQSLHTVSGDITTEFSGADVKSEAVSGDIEIKGNNAVGVVEADSVSGDVYVSGVSGEVTVETVTGEIEVTHGEFDRADLDTVNGHVDFVAAINDGGRLYVETVNGSVDVELTSDVSAKIYIETLNGGIRNCFGPDPVRTSKYGPGKELEFVEGKGNGRIDISTLNGGISLCR